MKDDNDDDDDDLSCVRTKRKKNATELYTKCFVINRKIE